MRTCTRCGESKPLTEFNQNYKRRQFDVYCKGCRSAYAKQYHQANKQRLNARNARWRRDNPERQKVLQQRYVARRRALKASVEANLPPDFWITLLHFYGPECARCGSAERLTHDHVLALSRGGEHTWLNSQVLCFSCNSSKQARNAIDYRDWMSGVLVGFLDGEQVVSRGDVLAVEELFKLRPGEDVF